MAVDKLVDSTQLNADLTSVANAIRAKGGTSASLAFPDGFVDAIDDIETGGSVTVSPLSVTANGTYTAPSGEAYSPVTVNVPTGGGASNVVTGTFTGTTTGAAMNVPLNYSGNGYPIAVMIFPSPSYANTFDSLIQRYAIRDYFAEKYEKNTAPTYSDNEPQNHGIMTHKYKSSTSNANNYADGGSTSISTVVYKDEDALSSNTLPLRIRTNKKMSVFIASTSYGFAANIEYTYYVIYSE